MSIFSWDKLQVSHKIIVFTLGAAVVSYLLYDFLLSPQLTHIDELTTQYKSEAQQLKIVEDFVLAHPNPEQHLADLDNKLMQIGNRLPDNPEISTLLLQIEQLSRECGVQLSHLKPTKIVNKDKEGYREFEVEFLISGSFTQNMNFLTKTENGLRFISLNNIAMKLDKKGIESKVIAKIYSFGVPPAPQSTNANAPNVKN